MKPNPPDSKYPKATFAEPTPYGYIYAGVTVHPPKRSPFVRKSKERDAALSRLRALTRQIETYPQVVKAAVHHAVFIPPVKGGPRFDIAVLIQTASPEVIADIQAARPFQQLNADFVMSACNIRRIGDTDRTDSETFLFNHFVADDPDSALEVWEDVTGWYTAKTGVDNSTILWPISDAPYAFVNYVRLPHGTARFLLNQFTRPSFGSYVRASLHAQRMTAMPLFYKPV